MKEKLTQLRQDSLVQNSFYLMVSTAVMAALGFLFWLIAARLFSQDDIGIATTLISAMTLISYIGLLGFNSTLIRILPKSQKRSQEINTALLLSTSAATVVATIYVLVIPLLAPGLSLVRDNVLYALGFILLVALACINLLTSSIFIAFRAAKYNLLIDGTIMSLTKLALPFALVGLGAFGLFGAAGLGAAAALIASMYFLTKKFNYKPRIQIDTAMVRDVWKYSFSNYAANLLNIAPTLILPLVVLNHLGAAAAGYYYLGSMVANLLYTVVYAVAQSLFAEGSYADKTLRELIKRSSLVIAAIMIPAVTVMYVGANFMLTIYGPSYAANATELLQVLALAGPFVAVYTIVNVLLRITKLTKQIIIIDVIYMIVIAGLAELWAKNGLVWVGYAWIIGNGVSGLAGLWFLWRHRHDKKVAAAATL
ncbi:MAG TPA: oligosaccharide flippase family protein [Candidatus Saccharimonadales bacterium]|nr:oligosaccharide flippase family protein [Candidatus Saccharimonadales bacterium]